MASLPTETQQMKMHLPSQRCPTSLFLMGGTSLTTSNAQRETNDGKLGNTTVLNQGKSLSRRILPIRKPEMIPPQFPNLSGSANVGANANNDGTKPSEQAKQQHFFNLLHPASSSSSDEMDIAREAMRLTRETLHGSMASNVAPLSTDARSRQDSSSSHGDMSSAGRSNESTTSVTPSDQCTSGTMRLNKFVRRLYNMLKECDSGLVEWRRGLLVLKDTHAFAKDILPKYFNTRNFKTFRRQLNYYGFVHIRSFSNNGDSTTALWVNGELAGSPCPAGTDPDHVSSVLLLRRVEPCDQVKTAEMRRARKELAISTIEKDFGVSAKTLQLQQLGNLRCSSSQKASPPNAKKQSMSSRAKQQQRRPVQSLPKSQATPVVVLEHHTNEPPAPMNIEQQQKPPEASSSTCPLPFPVESVNYNAADQQPIEAKSAAPLSSNMSAANLLLLLSKA